MTNFFKKNINAIVYISTIIFSIAFILIGNYLASPAHKLREERMTMETYTAKVTKIENIETEKLDLGGASNIESKTVTFKAKILDRNLKGLEITGTQYDDGLFPIKLKEINVNDKIVVHCSVDGNDLKWVYGEHLRSNFLFVLLLIFFGLLILFGKSKAFNTIISLIFTTLAIFVVLIPCILSGYNIYLVSLIVCIFVVSMSFILINGIHKKTLVAILGAIFGLLISSTLIMIFSHVLKISGMVDENSYYLLQLNTRNPLNLKALMFASVIIGSLGATMDVAMSIASPLYELYNKMKKRTRQSIIESGIEIGKDMLGTMSNTIILAYIGGSLSMLLLLIANTNSLTALLNKEMIVIELLQTLIGIIGILLTIPLTSIVCAYLYMGKEDNK